MPVIDLGSVVGPQGPQGATGATGAQGLQGNPGPNQVTNQTSTNLVGVLQGAASKVTVKPVDASPTASSDNLVSSGGVFDALKTRLPVNGMGKNLLDNWYFGNPVNQREQSSYTGSVYGIDRWKSTVDYTIADVISEGYRVKSSNGSNTAITEQTLENPSQLLGKTVFLTILLSSGAYSYSATVPSSFTNTTIINGANVQLVMTSGGVIVVRLTTNSSVGVVFVAVKLELGTEQTLCHNEGTAEAPVWVLNEIPDYSEELRKCQRYFLRIGKFSSSTNAIPIGSLTAAGATNAADYVVPLPTTMRNATPSLTYSGTITIYKADGSSSVTVSNLVLNTAYCSNISLHMTATFSPTVTKGTLMGSMILSGSGYVDISCEL